MLHYVYQLSANCFCLLFGTFTENSCRLHLETLVLREVRVNQSREVKKTKTVK